LLLTVALASPCHAAYPSEAQVAAAAFMNDYLRHLLALESGKTTLSTERWILNSKKVTRRLMHSYRALIKDSVLDPTLC
jgi:erythromycin esterase-like protein